MAKKLFLIAVEGYTPATPITAITGGVVVSEILDYRTYVNNLGQTVAAIETTSGLLPAIAITVPNTAAAQPVPYVTAAAVEQPDQNGLATPYAPQYAGSSGATGGFPATFPA